MNIATTCNISVRDAMLLMQPGQVSDMFDNWCRLHGVKREE